VRWLIVGFAISKPTSMIGDTALKVGGVQRKKKKKKRILRVGKLFFIIPFHLHLKDDF
jgi:hypothetical protein